MTVHILEPDDRPVALNQLTARIGFLALGEEVRMFAPERADDIALGRDDIVVGGVGIAQKAMRRMGMAVPVLETIPPPLLPFAGRRIWTSTMGELRRKVQAGEIMFAKPRPERLKLFTGQVFGAFRDLIATAHIGDDEPLDCAEPVRFVSEYRVFVQHGDPVDLRPYTGDPLIVPDPAQIRGALRAYRDGPAGYALDFGVTDDGRTLVMEVNDGYAIGAYGLAPVRYAALIAARWAELREQAAARDAGQDPSASGRDGDGDD